MTTPEAQPPATTFTASDGLAAWLRGRGLSLAFTSYQFGELVMAGVSPSGEVVFSRQQFGRAAGLSYKGGRMHLGGVFQLWRIENALRPGETRGIHDAVFVPRNAAITGDIYVHEIGVTADGKPLMVNTKFSCLCTLDPVRSFRPTWTPPFVSALAAEDRCHLNGLAMDKGRPRYVTVLSDDDVKDGWRARPRAGVLMEVETQRAVATGLAMPHSPRVADGALYVLESGRGMIRRVDPKSGVATDLAFCPGFLRGMTIVGDHALVTISRPSKASFWPHPIEDELARRGLTPWTGVLVVDLRNGDIVASIRVEGATTQLFDVVALPGIACPAIVGPQDMRSEISFDAAALPVRRRRGGRG